MKTAVQMVQLWLHLASYKKDKQTRPKVKLVLVITWLGVMYLITVTDPKGACARGGGDCKSDTSRASHVISGLCQDDAHQRLRIRSVRTTCAVKNLYNG